MNPIKKLFGAVLTLASVAGLVESLIRENVLLLSLTASLLIASSGYLAAARISLRSARIYDLRLRLTRFIGTGRLGLSIARALRVDTYPDRLALLSLDYAQARNMRRPLVAPTRVLSRRRYWPNWSFDIAVTFGAMKIRQVRRGQSVYSRLEVSLDDSTAGIYNNMGKTFLTSQFSNVAPSALDRLSNAAYQATRSQPNENSDAVQLDPKIPLRWASGGALVVANWKGREWVVLLFREIDPIGWNVANGASESATEHVDLQRLAFRELSEELIVLDGNPTEGLPVHQKSFILPWATADNDPLRSNQFSALHRRLRQEQDGLLLDPAVTIANGCPMDTIATDMEVLVRAPGQQDATIRNTIFTVNPRELGVEVLLPVRITLDDDDFLLDGEIVDELGDILARRPILLISVDYLRQQYETNGQLGSDLSLERRMLEDVPASEHFLFSEDLRLRKRRLRNINRALDSNLAVEADAEDGDNVVSILLQLPLSRIEREAQFHSRWLGLYEDSFAARDFSAPNMRTLCPATWKSVEIALRNNII